MGKIKRPRKKLQIASKAERTFSKETNPQNLPNLDLPLPSNDLFTGLNIDISTLKTKLNPDVQSEMSFKLSKSERSRQKIISKKEKLKMRRNILLKKIDVVKQMKKDLKLRQKRKSTAIIGDTNPLHDALPSLESLLKNRPSIKQNVTEPGMTKGIEKARKRKKALIQGVMIYKTVLSNKTFQKDPLEAISQHVKALVSQEKQKLKK